MTKISDLKSDGQFVDHPACPVCPRLMVEETLLFKGLCKPVGH